MAEGSSKNSLVGKASPSLVPQDSDRRVPAEGDRQHSPASTSSATVTAWPPAAEDVSGTPPPEPRHKVSARCRRTAPQGATGGEEGRGFCRCGCGRRDCCVTRWHPDIPFRSRSTTGRHRCAPLGGRRGGEVKLLLQR